MKPGDRKQDTRHAETEPSPAPDQRLEEARSRVAGSTTAGQLAGRSSAFTSALRKALATAHDTTPALLTGEHGSGRELLARIIHAGGPRAGEPFVAVHCGHLSAADVEAEMFGSDDEGERPDRLGATREGTLYLHEVNHLALATQDRLVSALRRATRPRVRLIAAAGISPDELAADNQFRGNLLLQLQANVIDVPPLRNRREDIPALARYYLEQFRKSAPVLAEGFSRDALDLLARYPWPGNLRELRNVVERTLVLHGQGTLIHAMHLPPEFTYPADDQDLDGRYTLAQAVNEFERDLVERALRQANGVQTRAAEILGTTRRVLKYRMEKLNISIP